MNTHIPGSDECTNAQWLLLDNNIHSFVGNFEIMISVLLQLFRQASIKFKAANDLILSQKSIINVLIGVFDPMLKTKPLSLLTCSSKAIR